MSPEQARGEKVVDKRADVYALGAILYELLSQQRPHPGDSQNAILHHIATQPAVPIASVQPDLPADLAEMIDQVLASERARRPPTADALGRMLAPFARREVWPPPPENTARANFDLISTCPASGDDRNDDASASGSIRPAPTGEDRASKRRERGEHLRSRALLGGALLVAVLAAAAGVARHVSAPVARAGVPPHARRSHALDPRTRLLSSDPPPGAVAQIASLLKTGDRRDAALLTAMVTTPTAIPFTGGSPEQVRTQVTEVVTRGERHGRVPVLVASNHPFRNCAGYGIMGDADTAAYKAWIDGFAAAIGNEPVFVLLEPNSLGLIPYGKWLTAGTTIASRPSRVRMERTSPSGATADERFAQLGYAVDVLAANAPNAAVYLDGTPVTGCRSAIRPID